MGSLDGPIDDSHGPKVKIGVEGSYTDKSFIQCVYPILISASIYKKDKIKPKCNVRLVI